MNGELLNHFEERFGELLAWKGYPYGDPAKSCRNRVWYQLPKEVATNISRRVVSLASFNGDFDSNMFITFLCNFTFTN